MRTALVDQSQTADAREAFLTSGIESPDVRPETLRAWRRSRAAGAPPDATPPIVLSGARVDTALRRAVESVAEATMTTLATADFAMMAIDRHGVVVGRWVADTDLATLLDAMGSVVGAHFDESIVGSTGLGTVLEVPDTTIVDGTEHFNRRFDPVIAVGTPIIHPATGRVEGALDLICPTGMRPETMVALVEHAARDIGRHLLSGYAARDHALLDAFLRTERRGPRRPILALNRRIVFANALASPLLARFPSSQLWPSAETALAEGHTSMILTDDQPDAVEIRLLSVPGPDGIEGAVLAPRRTRPAGSADTRVRATDLPTDPEHAGTLARLTYLENVERQAILDVLTSVGGNKRLAANVLGLSRSTLYRKLAALHME